MSLWCISFETLLAGQLESVAGQFLALYAGNRAPSIGFWPRGIEDTKVAGDVTQIADVGFSRQSYSLSTPQLRQSTALGPRSGQRLLVGTKEGRCHRRSMTAQPGNSKFAGLSGVSMIPTLAAISLIPVTANLMRHLLHDAGTGRAGRAEVRPAPAWTGVLCDHVNCAGHAWQCAARPKFRHRSGCWLESQALGQCLGHIADDLRVEGRSGLKI